MIEESEERMYHIICNISGVCRDYFYGRKYLPSDFWKMEDEIKAIISNANELKKEYKNYGSKNK